MWKDELDIIIREKSAYGEKVNRGASESIITLLKDKAAAELHTELPDGYPEFLLAVNGIEFNGYIIYGVYMIRRIRNTRNWINLPAGVLWNTAALTAWSKPYCITLCSRSYGK